MPIAGDLVAAVACIRDRHAIRDLLLASSLLLGTACAWLEALRFTEYVYFVKYGAPRAAGWSSREGRYHSEGLWQMRQ